MDKNVWPNFIIVGAARAGTTSMYEYLKQFPEIYMSPIKEPHYFLSEMGQNSKHLFHTTTENEYLSLFDNVKSEKAIGEASPSYLWDPLAPQRIKKNIPGCRIIIILRDPVDRAYSQFLYDLRYGYEKTLDFYKAVTEDYCRERKGWGTSHLYVELGMYSKQIDRYFHTFGKEHVKILIFEEFVRDIKRYVKEVTNFLDVGFNIDEKILTKVYNSTSDSFEIPRNRYTWQITKFIGNLRKKSIWFNNSVHLPASILGKMLTKTSTRAPLTNEAHQFLQKTFYDDANEVQKLLERSLPWKITKSRIRKCV